MADKGYTNPELLISPDELHERLGDESLCIVDVRPTHEYAENHIPGAIHLDLYGISLNDTRQEPFEAFMWMFSYLMHSRGIGTENTVVFYESNSGMRAARGFWIAEYHGHKDVHVLDGGLSAWVDAGHPVTTKCPVPSSATFDSNPIPNLNIGFEEILASLGNSDFIPMDTRSEDEYYARIVRAARGGAIPGAVHIEYVDNLDEAGAFKPAAELREMCELAGITHEKTVVCY